MRINQAVKAVGVVGIISIVVTACLWNSCSKQHVHIMRDVQVAPSDFQAEFHHRGTNSIKTSTGVVASSSSIKYHEIECLINEDYPVKCRREGHEVYLPFSFVQKYFEVYGKLEIGEKSERLVFQHSNSKVHPPRQTYSPAGVFMSFEFYHVEERDRVKCISAVEGVPFSTQWTPEGHFYPVQIAQYGLSHYSKHLVEGVPEVLVMDDGEEEDAADWAKPDSRAKISLLLDTDKNHVVEFQVSDSLKNPGLVMIADEKEDYVMTVDVFFISNGSLTVTVETRSGQTFNIHYVLTSTLISMDNSDIFYGLGPERNRWIHLARDIKIDLQKGLSLKYSKARRNKSRYQFSRIRDIAVRGHGRLDNLTLARSAHMDHCFAAADWLVRHQDSHGGWPIVVARKLLPEVMELPPGWYSAMAQGQAMSLLVRAYLVTSNPKYLQAAVNAMKLFEINSDQGGVLSRFLGQYDWYEEYPTSPSSFVLNGFVYALLGLYDLKETAKGDDGKMATRLYEAGMKSLKAMLLMFDSGTGTFYDLRHITMGIEPNRARWDYHTTHINQLLQLVVIDSDPLFKTTAQRWIGYMKGQRARHN